MSDYLRLALTFLDPRFHGRGDSGPEWPPSPLRVMQAIVAANGDDIGGDLDSALGWLESQAPPLIIAPSHEEAEPYCLSVPNNAMDLVGRAWSRGNYFGGGDANPAKHRTMKTIRPVRLVDGDTVHYLWKLDVVSQGDTVLVESVMEAAGRIVALGWGVDLVVGFADRISSEQLQNLPGERWLPVVSANVAALRTPVKGTLAALKEHYSAFLHRIEGKVFTPVEPLTQFGITGYRRSVDPLTRPYAVFELRHDDGSLGRYAQRKLTHIAGMVRHLARKAMQRSPPAGLDNQWVERYVVGHRDEDVEEHRQFSYLPLPSIGHEHADHVVRRVMVAGPVGDDEWLEHLARRLSGQQLTPEQGNEFGEEPPPTLVRVQRRSARQRGRPSRRGDVVDCYTAPTNRWTSVTPVILPGHDDRKPAKTRKLIDAALAQSGIDQACSYEWSAFPRLRKSLSAHKYDRNKCPIFIKPEYLRELTAVHLTVTFSDEVQVPGPLVIGAGRHRGFGLMAGSDT